MKHVLKLFALLAFSACGASPLLHHETASSVRRPESNVPVSETAPVATESETCSLRFEHFKLCASIEWEQMPTEEAEGSFLVRFWSQSPQGPYTSPQADVAVQLWMPSMGHGSSPVKVNAVSEGVYRATRVFFVMPGDWQIRLQLKSGRQVADEAVQDIQI